MATTDETNLAQSFRRKKALLGAGGSVLWDLLTENEFGAGRIMLNALLTYGSVEVAESLISYKDIDSRISSPQFLELAYGGAAYVVAQKGLAERIPPGVQTPAKNLFLKYFLINLGVLTGWKYLPV
jgi:hypothetical protein